MSTEDLEFVQSPTHYQDDAPKTNTTTTTETRPSLPTGRIFTTFLTLKVIPFGFYMFSGIFFSNSVFQWVLCILSSSIDFWFTKNVAGRLILGMRWTNIVNKRGESTWKFEYARQDSQDKAAQKKYFWLFLFVSAGVWGLFTFFNVIRLNLGWVLVTGVSCALASTNAWGFLKCDHSVKDDVQRGASSFFRQTVFPLILQNGTNLFAGNTNTQPATQV
ncbi:hypothetical protein TVAG_403270 [Trichomonas vaginalis G3]|uniref:Golgi apparatus membrane protein TVP23 homolog n=1 Tax=Trichomonas vaginalis (strain ATCC PRA-98 / G3) TaxID=412133 RepID=A2F8W3_TRIV3|nr:vesicle-mediated transport [Trichomonas vaginalis G3]EAX98645.1 hypothetical protein TVAG_403270 [Trichomonas vaginalis G3]KAI5508441.1 vesicle-mediated transport [Trichomonas vaginalis G3]|eukprot:XP_001311575.1 hypothetical protein [Trichomonas vaginalis G3]